MLSIRISFPASAICLITLLVVLWPGDVRAQVARTFPTCAAPDSQFTVETNLWPRVYHHRVIHRVYFDWTGALSTPIYAVQTDYAVSWAVSVSVPHVAITGAHSIRVEQLEMYDPPNSGFQRTGCVYIPFQVAASPGDPWSASHDTTISASFRDSTNKVGKVFVFDPSLTCDVAACEAIRLIQVQQDVAIVAGLPVPLPATGRYLDGPARDSTRTAGGFMVDAWGPVPGMTFSVNGQPVLGERDPYLNGNDAGYDNIAATVGYRNADSTNISRFRDAPFAPDSSTAYPPGISELVKRFETCAFCSQGAQSGRYLGKLTWRWRRPILGVATIDSTQTNRAQPSPMFLEALEKWVAVRSQSIPEVETPTTGGIPCQ